MNISTPVRLALFCLVLNGCVPLTLSREAAIDFEAYKTIRVEVNIESFEQYIVGELSDVSGFQNVTSNPNQDVDAVLYIDILDTDSDYSDGELGRYGRWIGGCWMSVLWVGRLR